MRVVCGVPSAGRLEPDVGVCSLHEITDRRGYHSHLVMLVHAGGSAIISQYPPPREEVDEVVHRRLFQPFLVLAQREDRLLLLWGIATSEIGFELGEQLGYAFRAAPAVAQRILDFDFGALGAVPEKYLHGIGNRALGRVQVVTA